MSCLSWVFEAVFFLIKKAWESHIKIQAQLKVRKNGQQKLANCFATLRQNELKSDVANFTTYEPNLQKIRLLHVAKGCCREHSSSTFCNKLCTCRAFYWPKANLFCSKWRNSRVRRDSRLMLSNQKSVPTQCATTWFGARQVWLVGSKKRNIAIQLV